MRAKCNAPFLRWPRWPTPETFARKYDLTPGAPVLLFAMGDGNHSLATAKAIWEQVKADVGMDHPARYALVEVENIHDAGLTFEAIHRVLFGVKGDLAAALEVHFGDSAHLLPCASEAEMIQRVDDQRGPEHLVGVIREDGFAIVAISAPTVQPARWDITGLPGRLGAARRVRTD